MINIPYRGSVWFSGYQNIKKFRKTPFYFSLTFIKKGGLIYGIGLLWFFLLMDLEILHFV